MPFVQVLTNSPFKYTTTYMRSGDSRLRMTTTKSRLRPTYTLCVGLRPVNLEFFAPLGDFENLSPRMDLEIFAPLEH
ncbi:hypothetical protein V1477_017600 [Vespula maculifrons]|uniref:Uncharacterized protein n=1 Tax=Vespula maculifrons TaxID=7453 RepID=A0ABD2B6I6_VESMC